MLLHRFAGTGGSYSKDHEVGAEGGEGLGLDYGDAVAAGAVGLGRDI